MLPALSVTAHVLTVFWLVAGIIGRDVCYAQAGRAVDLATLRTLVELGTRFERAMVRPATFVVLLTGLVAAWMRGWPILGILQGGSVNWVLAALLVYLSIIPVIVFVFVPKGRAYHRALEDAVARNQVTPQLAATLRDPAVRAARWYEMVMIATLTILMILKPF